MRYICLRLSYGALFLSLFVLCEPGQARQQQSQPVVSTIEEIGQDFVTVPCDNKARLSAARALFEKMNAPQSAISVEQLPGVDNLVIRHQGTGSDIVVIGAHYDLADLGCGAVDNWTGVVAVAHLYRTIRSFKTDKTVLFVVFGKEERGLIGSKAMVKSIPSDDTSHYCAMINIDSFGLAAPFALAGSSSKKLMTLAGDISNEMKIPFTTIQIPGADSDSSSFIAKKIPAVTLSGLTADWRNILHTTADQRQRVNPSSVYLGYRLALTMWSRIDQAACDSYR